jgi:hypothetical protein
MYNNTFSLVLIIMIEGFSFVAAYSMSVYLQPKDAMAQTTEQSKNNSSNAINFLTYENPIVGIKIQYPSNWDKQENIKSSSGNSTLVDLVTFSSPFKNNSDTIAQNLDVKIDNISDIQPTTLAGYANDTVTDLRQDFKVIESNTNATLAGNPAYKFVYTGIEESVNLQAMIVLTIKGDRAYIISYTAQPAIYSYYLPTIQKMINSFEITK